MCACVRHHKPEVFRAIRQLEGGIFGESLRALLSPHCTLTLLIFAAFQWRFAHFVLTL